MTYQEIFKKVKTSLAKANPAAVNGDLAIEFDIVGEGEGKFYVEVKDGKLNVEPYDYVDNNAKIFANAETLISLAKGELKPESAYAEGLLAIEGDVGRALDFKALVESVPAPRKRRSKAEIEAEKAAKEAAKAAKEAEKAEKAEKAPAKKAAAKPAAKKTAAKKPAAKKTEE